MEPPAAGKKQQDSDDHLRESDPAGSGGAQETGDEREAQLDAREVRADAMEAAQADRQKQAQRILADATERDARADARDSASDSRDTAAGRHSFLTDSEGQFGPAFKARRAAALDRSESKADRTAAAADRSELTGVDPAGPGTEADADRMP